MPYAILRFKKRKAGSVASCERHNERKKEATRAIPILILDAPKRITTLYRRPATPTRKRLTAWWRRQLQGTP